MRKALYDARDCAGQRRTNDRLIWNAAVVAAAGIPVPLRSSILTSLGIIALSSVFVVCVGALSLSAAELSDDRPNIVLVVADDLGWMGVGCYGSTFYETPNIDRLATDGMRFTSAFAAASTCAPSRASIMSGQYTPKHRVLYVGPGTFQEKWREKSGNLKRFPMLQPRGETELPAGVQTVAENLKDAGYRTGMFGKWHLGTRDQHPARRGFDTAIESHGKHFGFTTDPSIEHPSGQYLSDFLSDQAADFIKQQTAEDEPFFLYYADFLVHKPFEAKADYLRRFEAKTPSQHQRSPMAGAMIKSLDDSVGKILAAIDESGCRDNTLFLFTSDNGGLSYEEDGIREANTSNLPLRGRKGSEYDGGLRIPWIVRWPGHVPAHATCDVPVHHVDLFPTFGALGRAARPAQELHGVDLTSLFLDPQSQFPDRKLYWYLPGYSSFHTPSVMVRQGDWKLVRRLESLEFELYNTRREIGESTDLSQNEPSRGSDLNQAAIDWLDRLDAPRMVPNPEYDPR